MLNILLERPDMKGAYTACKVSSHRNISEARIRTEIQNVAVVDQGVVHMYLTDGAILENSTS